MTEIIEETYRRPDLPRDLEIQVRTFGRIAWFDEPGEDPFRERMRDQPDAMHFVRRANSLVISHVRIIPQRIEGADGRNIEVAGLGGVLTFPAFRGQGHATALMRRAQGYIDEAGFDLGMLFCDATSEPFYGRLGWRTYDPERLIVGGGSVRSSVMTFGDTSHLAALTHLQSTW